jgi:vacuolar iron transporter family protein
VDVMVGGLTVEQVFEERQSGRIASRMNWLRAGVMGANDGIVSTAGVVVGVAGVSVSSGALLASGIAAVAAGAMSMAVGEYVSVSSQRDSQAAETDPEGELDQLTGLIQTQGIHPDLARRVAAQLTEKDALTPRTPASSWVSTPTSLSVPGTRPGSRWPPSCWARWCR